MRLTRSTSKPAANDAFAPAARRWGGGRWPMLTRFIQSLPLQVQLALLTGVLCVLLVSAVSFGAAALGRRQAETDAASHLALLARELGHRLDSSMAQRFEEVHALASVAPLQPLWTGDPALLRSVLEQLQGSYPSYAWIGFAGTDGIVRASTSRMLEGQSVSARDWFRSGLHGPTAVDLHEATLLGRLLSAPGSAEPLRFLDVAFPVLSPDGRVLGVLGAHLYSRWIGGVQDNFAAVLAAAEPSLRGRLTLSVLSADGHVVVGPQPGSAGLSAALVQQVAAAGAVVHQVTVDGVTMLEALAVTHGERNFAGLGWIVSAREPISVAYGPVRSMVAAILGTGAVVAAAGVGLLFLLTGRLSSPIRKLCLEAGRMGRAEPGAKLNHVGGCREVLLLSHALRSLVRRLGLTEQQLTDARARATANSAQAAVQIESLRRMAQSDPMTGLLNRRGFLEMMQRNFRQPTAELGVLIIDIDHFKRVNDRFGHAVGDTVIRCIADAVKRTVRQEDLVARFGGEEFVVCTPRATATSLLALAERIRQAVAQLRPIDGHADGVTVSIGAAVEEIGDHDIQDTIDRADVALYGAKESGHNRVRLSEEVLRPLVLTAA